ncbi:hypothetical protein HYU06_07425 [Candidatus Woesearchaeota archaeon]|nr:hypothetical protein [Candidatus Woesearchaeota archaeon]
MAETISLTQVYDELKKIEKTMVTKKEIDSLIDTINIMGNPETLHQISSSLEDIKQGKVKRVNSVKDLLSEM